MVGRLAIAWVALSLGTGAAVADALSDCGQGRSSDIRMRACTEVINGTAFGSLHARHPSLALREPLSRGIAAPHDEMPKFTLSGAEIDTIVAYINSLTLAGGNWAPSVKRSMPISDEQDIGDARKGLSYAQRVCATCHNVLRTEAASPNGRAPTFKRIANTPGMSITALTVWSRTVHPTMPNLVIDANDMDDLIAYILGLRDRK